MRLSITVSILLGAAASVAGAGFTIPENQIEGTYSVFVHENGTEEHTRLADPSTDISDHQAIKRNSRILGRQNNPDTTTCAPTSEAAELNHGECDAANSDLDHQCDIGTAVWANQNIYSIRGCTVAYFCNTSGYKMGCSSYARGQFSLSITNKCGRYHPGWGRYVGGAMYEIQYSYGYEDYCSNQGKKFCGGGA